MKIALLGDIALFGRYDVHRNPAIRWELEAVAEYLHGFDLVIGNLETPFTTSDRVYGAKSAHLKADPRGVELLKFLGVHAVSLANNHIYDYGRTGLNETIDTLDRAGIRWAGVDGQHVSVREGGGGISLRAYCSWNTNPLGRDRSLLGGGVTALVVSEMCTQIARDKSHGLLPIVSVHSGDEHVHYPSYDDIRLARGLDHAGPYVYYGHHPHVIQALELINGSIHAYSLGNFCFDDVYSPLSESPLIRQSVANRNGLILGVEVRDARICGHSAAVIRWEGACELVVGEGAREQIAQFALPAGQRWQEYEASRRAQVAAWRGERKKSRDLSWYWKRLRWRSARQLMASRLNHLNYQAAVVRQLDSLAEEGSI